MDIPAHTTGKGFLLGNLFTIRCGQHAVVDADIYWETL